MQLSGQSFVFPPYLLPKDGSETELIRFFELVFDPRRANEETQKELAQQLLPLLAIDGLALATFDCPRPGRL